MKRNEIREELRREAEEHTPDLYDRIVSAAEREKGGKTVLPEERRRSRITRRTALRIAAVGTAALLCLGIAVPVAVYFTSGDRTVVQNPPNGGNGTENGGGTDGSGVKQLSAEEAYGLGAITTVSLIGSAFGSDSAVSLSAAYKGSGTESLAERQAETFHDYFLMLESFMGEGMLQTSAVRNADAQFAEYDVKLTVTGKDLYGNEISHLMYYTETLVHEKSEKGETEAVYALEGVMVTERGNYTLYGERETEIESDGKETEREEEFRMRAYPDASRKDSYVEMRQELSVEEDETEKKYVYSVIDNGTLTEETVLRFESETKNGKEQVQYRLEFLSGKGKGSYKLEKESADGGSRIRVEYEIDGEGGDFRIAETESGDYVYSFSDGNAKVFRKK